VNEEVDKVLAELTSDVMTNVPSTPTTKVRSGGGGGGRKRSKRSYMKQIVEEGL